MQKPPQTGHHSSVPFELPHIDMCTLESSEIRTPPYTGQLTVVPVVSLLGRFHCAGQLMVVPVVSLLGRFHCAGQIMVVPVVSLLGRFHCAGQLMVVPVVSLLGRFHCAGQLMVVPVVSLLGRFQSTFNAVPTSLVHQPHLMYLLQNCYPKLRGICRTFTVRGYYAWLVGPLDVHA